MKMVTTMDVVVKREVGLAVIDVASVLRCADVNIEYLLIHGIW